MNRLQKIKNNSSGFGHIEFVLIIAVVLVIGGVGYYVYNHGKSNNKNSQVDSLSTASKSNSPAQSKTTVTTAKPLTQAAENTPPSTAPSSDTTSTSTTTSTKTDTTSKTTASTTPTPSPTPAPTPLSTLTNIISGLDNGVSANVTASDVTIPGPITNALGRPIVFTLDGQTYFAYTQEHAPNFNTSAPQTASTMAIVPTEGSGYTLTQAHLDKDGNLVDENESAVGYSTGGD